MNNPTLETIDTLTALLESLKDYSGKVRLSEPSDVASRYIGLRQIGKLADTLRDALQEEVRSYLDDGELLEFQNQYITYQASSPRKSVDWAKLEKNDPELLDLLGPFIKESTSKPSVVVKVKESND